MRTLALFARRPIPGEVKTRLSPALPAELAAYLYRAMLADALAAAAAAEPDRLILYWASSGPPVEGLPLPGGLAFAEQAPGDLGARLAAAFAELLVQPADRAVVMGADCPDLDAAVIREAFAALDEHDVVLGPARDGGYYLIGLRRPAPALFADVSWGSQQVLAETLTRAERAGLSVARLASRADLDTPADLVAFAARRAVSAPGAGHHTEAALRAIGLMPPPP